MSLEYKKSSQNIIEKSQFESTLDIRGLLLEEVQQQLETFLDKAMMHGINHLKILHGRGTGTLRNYVQQFLKKYPYTKKYYFEREEFGGNGITIVELK
jgi:DNA mismatch repair protein MutS2